MSWYDGQLCISREPRVHQLRGMFMFLIQMCKIIWTKTITLLKRQAFSHHPFHNIFTFNACLARHYVPCFSGFWYTHQAFIFILCKGNNVSAALHLLDYKWNGYVPHLFNFLVALLVPMWRKHMTTVRQPMPSHLSVPLKTSPLEEEHEDDINCVSLDCRSWTASPGRPLHFWPPFHKTITVCLAGPHVIEPYLILLVGILLNWINNSWTISNAY